MRQPFRTPKPVPYRLLRVSTRDQPWLDRLRRNVYRDLFIATFGRWEEARHVRHIQECWDRGDISLIQVDGERAGMIQILDRPGFVEIGELQIEPSHQNRGIGSLIVSDIVKQAHKRGKTVTSSVALKNDRAYRFYQRHGFRRVSQTETHHHLQCEPER